MGHKYSTKATGENIAKAMGTDLPISSKQSFEISSWLRGKNLALAKEMLQNVIDMKVAVPYKKFNKNVGHKAGKGMAAGRYPIKSAFEFLKLVESVEANAQFKGLNTANLVIIHIVAQRAARAWHYGRHRGRKMKRTTVEIVVQEKAPKVKKEREPRKNILEKNTAKKATEEQKGGK